jgi:hypothetical protein
MNKEKVSIVSCSYKTKEMTLNFISELKKLEYKNIEIIIVDDGSNDETAESIKKKFKEVIIIKNEKNLGFSKANNVGIKKTSGKYIILINNDLNFPDKKIISKLINVFKAYEKIGILFCKVVGLDGKIQNRVKTPEIEHKVNIGGGPLMFFDASTIKKVNGFDEGFSPAYYEDNDLSLRLIKKGYSLIYTPKTWVIHKGGGTTKNKIDFYYLSAFKNSIRFSIIYMDFFYFLKFNTKELLKSIYRKKLHLYIKCWIINLKEIRNLISLRKKRRTNINFFKERFF